MRANQRSRQNVPRPRPRPDTAEASATSNAEVIEQVEAANAAGAGAQEAKAQPTVATATAAILGVVPADMQEAAKTSLPEIVQQLVSTDVRNVQQAAYILATAQHESSFGDTKFSWSEPLVEDHNQYRSSYNKKTKRETWSATVHTTGDRVTGATESELDQRYWDNAYGGNLENKSGTADAANYRGRGFVQLTGRRNYREFTKKLNDEGFSYELDGQRWGAGGTAIDLLAHPDHVNRSRELAARIMIDGMMEGTFTGQSLPDHVNDQETDYYDARSVVNGDKGKNGRSIEAIAQRYEAVLAPFWQDLVHPEWALPMSPTGERRGPV